MQEVGLRMRKRLRQMVLEAHDQIFNAQTRTLTYVYTYTHTDEANRHARSRVKNERKTAPNGP